MAPLTLNLSQGSVTFPFSAEAGRELRQALGTLTERLKTVAQAMAQKERPPKEDSLEYRHGGEVFLEIFCNPNLYASPFAAKVLLTLRDERLRLVTEGELSQLLADLDAYLAQF
ncbi:MAG: hypothetical protein GC158_17255 [Cyanobacteria bacterium RI_101]|jgi:hypothetical protein|nr:hypothetical protein [Cyanobacteria bacterium RI_101]